jgi:protocatechuate 3,4-dioxygenase beta subunit
MREVFASFAVIAILILGAGSAAAQTGILQGTVSDADTGLPIEGARVMARAGAEGIPHPGHGFYHAVTDENGAYAIDEVDPGDYTVICGAHGYFRANEVATVVGDMTTILDFALDPLEFGSVDGMVSDAVTGDPIAGAWVGLRHARGDAVGGHGWLGAVTDELGMYLIENVPVGDYEARSHAFGYLPSDPVPLTVIVDGTTTVDLALDPLAFGGLEGTVTDAVTGLAIEGARVNARRMWGMGDAEGGEDGWWNRTFTDENGFYSLDELEVATYSVSVFAHGYFPVVAEVEVLEGQATVHDVALEPLTFGSLEGTVTDSDTGDPVEGARVVFFPVWGDGHGGGGGHWMTQTDENGFYLFEEVAAGAYRVMVFAHGYMPAMAEVEVVEGQATVADFALEEWSGPGRSLN